ncbi:hypothetical protein JVT61DRAFT_7617 [Boletus reticuloceps]|uniref:Uncharacterized protein n=1 Tax=Boletus reticuloceps TaxID=495285 RepID=A0A8I3A601_9AGAM|nr:hypothetical protein JVT61DRAFT_7617 [Boletus reticuloceps]
MDTRQLEIVKYLVPGVHKDPFSLRVNAETMVFDIISHFRSQVPGAHTGVAYLPKDLALNISPVHDLVSRFTAVACRLEYLKDETKIFSLDLYDKTDKIQFFIQSHPDHDELIQRAGGRWAPSTVSGSIEIFKEQQDKHLVHNGRPVHVSGPPITIYEEAFADIVHDLANPSDQQLDDYTLSKATELSIALLKIYETESLRVTAISQLIENLLDVKFELNYSPWPSTGVESDGAAIQDGAIYLHLECKNELGIGGIADFQGALTLLKHISGTAYSPIRNLTRCPCVHLAISGPFIAFAGSVVTDIYNFQSFTGPISPGGETYPTDKIRGLPDSLASSERG